MAQGLSHRSQKMGLVNSVAAGAKERKKKEMYTKEKDSDSNKNIYIQSEKSKETCLRNFRYTNEIAEPQSATAQSRNSSVE